MNKEELKLLWEDVLVKIAPQIPQAHFITWFEKTAPLSINDNVFILGVPNSFHQSWLNNKYLPILFKAVKEINSSITKVQIEVDTKLNNAESDTFVDIDRLLGVKKKGSKRKESTKNIAGGRDINGLNSRYTFDNYIVGDENRLAFAASKAVSQDPGKAYNPLFIYGGVGLGKTHLLQAIGNSVSKNYGKRNVIYVTSEQFTNELVDAIKDRKGKKFKEKYRDIDVLIIDDIQFLSNKVQTQIEFFHTFNDLYHNNKQIVLSCDRPPREISALEERLRSRFEAGMLTDIQPPDFETKIAILRSKCQEKGHLLPNEVLEFIAKHSQENIRELEGVLIQIFADIELTNNTPTIDTVKKIIRRTYPTIIFEDDTDQTITGIIKDANVVSYSDIINVTAEVFSIKPSDIQGSSRKQEIVIARQMCMYLIRKELGKSFEYIGELFGGRNHTTVMHACNKMEKEINNNKNILKVYNSLKKELFR